MSSIALNALNFLGYTGSSVSAGNAAINFTAIVRFFVQRSSDFSSTGDTHWRKVERFVNNFFIDGSALLFSHFILESCMPALSWTKAACILLIGGLAHRTQSNLKINPGYRQFSENLLKNIVVGTFTTSVMYGLRLYRSV